MEKKEDIFVEVTKDGPYVVHGNPKIKNASIEPNDEGEAWSYAEGEEVYCEKDPTALCRCGRSKGAPCCDGSHENGPWDSEETSDFEDYEEEAQEIEGPNLTLMDNEKYCAYARFCDAKGRVWNLVQAGDEETDKLAIQEACNCPGGRLVIKDNKTGEIIEPEYKKEIWALEDPAIGCSGPLQLKGGIMIKSASGKTYQIRNRETICRCGCSSNKPFCDGSHASVKYKAGKGTMYDR